VVVEDAASGYSYEEISSARNTECAMRAEGVFAVARATARETPMSRLGRDVAETFGVFDAQDMRMRSDQTFALPSL
jgi:hypothetical protein